MRHLLPPVFRGKIPTTSGRLLAAAGVMFLLDLPVFIFFTGAGLLFHFAQVLVVIAVLLFSARRWVAALLLALISLAACCVIGSPAFADFGEFAPLLAAFSLLPLWVGTFIAYPRPRKRVVYVEVEEDEEEEQGGAGC